MFDISGCKLIGKRITNEIIYSFESLTSSDYVSSGTSGHAGGDLLVRKTLDEIQNLMND